MQLRTSHGVLHFRATAAYAALVPEQLESLPVSQPSGHSSNTVVALDETLFLKGYRFVRPGVNLEYEMGRYLTEVARFPHVVPMLGVLEHEDDDGTVRTLAIAQGYASNQGDGWAYVTSYLQRHLTLSRAQPESPDPEAHAAFLQLMRTLGLRTAQLHAALSISSGDPMFDPHPLTQSDLDQQRSRIREEAAETLRMLEGRLDMLPDADRSLAQLLLAAAPTLSDALDMPIDIQPGALCIRCHGDYHLGQVLVTRNDFLIIDFEGEPSRPLAARRAKRSPWLDVAGMLRSFSYARLCGLRAVAQDEEELRLLTPLAEHWEAQTRLAFIEGYGPAHDEALLRLFELDKALYELRYELNNRPDWARIPLQGILTLLGGV
jgi:maltose alpha-D-glucosyltransferase/alpha-amylase